MKYAPHLEVILKEVNLSIPSFRIIYCNKCLSQALLEFFFNNKHLFLPKIGQYLVFFYHKKYSAMVMKRLNKKLECRKTFKKKLWVKSRNHIV